MIPRGVHGTRPGLPRTRRPRLAAVRPSTSLSGGMRSMTGSASRPARQRQLDEDAVDGRVGGQLGDDRLHLGLAGVGRRGRCGGTAHADCGRLLLLRRHVAPARGVVADEHGGQADVRRPQLHEVARRRAARTDLGQRLAVHDLCGHGPTVAAPATLGVSARAPAPSSSRRAARTGTPAPGARRGPSSMSASALLSTPSASSTAPVLLGEHADASTPARAGRAGGRSPAPARAPPSPRPVRAGGWPSGWPTWHPCRPVPSADGPRRRARGRRTARTTPSARRGR